MDLLLQEVQRGDLTDREALALHERLTVIKLRLLNDRVSRRTAWDIARAQGWGTIGHAECIALVTLQADALITTDADLAAAEPVERLPPEEHHVRGLDALEVRPIKRGIHGQRERVARLVGEVAVQRHDVVDDDRAHDQPPSEAPTASRAHPRL